MKSKKKRLIPAAASAALIIVADQLSKAVIVSHLAWGEVRTFIPGLFNIVHYKNRGAAFGFLGSGGDGADLRLLFLTIVSIAALAIITVLILRSDDRKNTVALSLIAGGATGNLIDRARHGSVVDFLDIYVAGYHWPAFNIADSAITTGVVIMLYIAFFSPNDKAGTKSSNRR